MIYTIGNKQLYDELFSSEGHVTKTGKTEGYDGGIVWQTEQEAGEFLANCMFYEGKEHYAAIMTVYGVEAVWDIDTVFIDDGEYPGTDYQYLLIDAEVVQLDNIQ